MPTRRQALKIASFLLLLLAWMLGVAQVNADRPNYSGMYSFLRDGEFVQITVENGRVIGFVSRYSGAGSDQDSFVDHFFKSGTIDGNQLSFITETVGGISFEFKGTVERGEGKTRGEEAYYVLKGTLVENTSGEGKKPSSRPSEVALKSFPLDVVPPPAQKK